MQPTVAHALTYVAIASLVVWRVYARFRKLVGRQRLSRVRPWITLILFPTLVLLIAAASFAHPARLFWLVVALACGGALGVFGLRHTRFEAIRGEGLFYTPHAHLGIALSLLFVARIGYRLYEVTLIDPQMPRSAGEFARSPLTILLFGLLAGYYISYAVGLARWRARVMRAKREREEAADRSCDAAPPTANSNK